MCPFLVALHGAALSDGWMILANPISSHEGQANWLFVVEAQSGARLG